MCTLTLAWRAFGDAPVALAATRDEALDRPSEPPAVRGGTDDDGGVRYVAPRDAEAGGTWIGVSEGGLVVAVTNRWLDADRDGDRSRGLLVRDCLTAASAEAAVKSVERELDERAYAGFNLVLADDRAAFLLMYDGGLVVTRLDPGVHVVGNVGGVVNGAERFAVPERRREFGEGAPTAPGGSRPRSSRSRASRARRGSTARAASSRTTSTAPASTARGSGRARSPGSGPATTPPSRTPTDRPARRPRIRSRSPRSSRSATPERNPPTCDATPSGTGASRDRTSMRLNTIPCGTFSPRT
ncbi:hypothetical protein C463_16267 [Halorubrum californiense DSM 19288]|uniref:NRDE family protein n=1 Tax=Halorubrum californiense DSM 19288 TaxID=1227465 RepID=M0E159_9EURY|nr:hypothetical protein C463_16267 [Halorubrum californiense DSM 19288]